MTRQQVIQSTHPWDYSFKKETFALIRQQTKVLPKSEYVLSTVKSRTVLDVGCVGQDRSHESPHWLHGKMKNCARDILGVDINLQGIRELNQKGYATKSFDDLSDEQRMFERITILDVIEHVDDPVKLLDDYSQFLEKDGRFIITTPNPFRALNFLSVLSSDDYAVNYEHTFWLCPKTMTEIVRRTQSLKVAGFYWINEYENATDYPMGMRVKLKFGSLMSSLRRKFSPSFAMELINRV